MDGLEIREYLVLFNLFVCYYVVGGAVVSSSPVVIALLSQSSDLSRVRWKLRVQLHSKGCVIMMHATQIG